jgi:4-alpha-glucanotransferase
MTETERPARRGGVLCPLFACPSSASWGIGDIDDIAPITAWLAAAGQRLLQLLPINEMAPNQHSPYSAISAMAIDPLFISLRSVPDFEALGGEASLSPDDRRELTGVREARRIDYATVRRLKQVALRAAYERFVAADWCRDTTRARDLAAFVHDQSWWLDEYGLFRAIHAREGERPWTEWPGGVQRRDPAALSAARRDLGHEVLFHQYLQWLAALQWQRARDQAGPVELFGDLPFMVDGDSADVWARQEQFRLDMSVGVPPDAFSSTGQDWGMPLYRWDVMAARNFDWLHDRARRSRDLYEGYRIDHLVGFYRTYGRSKIDGTAAFTPDKEESQLLLGEKIMRVFRDAGAAIIAEDLGTVPDFVRESLMAQRIPGFRVFRWERRWHTEGQPFIDPSEYPPVSVAASGTHDTETLMTWWASLDHEERGLVEALPTVHQLTGGGEVGLDALVEALFASASHLLILPIQDVFGWSDRINTPGSTTDENWTFRLPWPIDRIDESSDARARQSKLRHWSVAHGR